MKRTILLHPDPRLKKLASPVTGVDDTLRKLATDMLDTMYDAPGIGLAAPQVGILDRIVVVDCEKDPANPPDPIVMINPEILGVSEDFNVYEEGCLSLPDQFADVTRPAEIDVRWSDLEGAVCEAHFDGLWATCIQHEIDHLDGKLFIDYLKPLKRQMITRKMQKMKRELARDGVKGGAA